MDDFDDGGFWRRPPRDRREHVTDQLARLAFAKPDAPKPPPGPMELTEDERQAFYERQDQLFAADYVLVAGGPYPISKTLARQLGYEVDRLPAAEMGYTAGDADAQPD
jgi:hypothetical protein